MLPFHHNKAQALLESAVRRHPQFLWGLNDLSLAYFSRGIRLQLAGEPSAKQWFWKGLEQLDACAALDPSYMNAGRNALAGLGWMVLDARTDDELGRMLSLADNWFGRCKAANSQYYDCYNNYAQVYAQAAERTLLAGRDPKAWLQRARENQAVARQQAGSLLDLEQFTALTHLVDARNHVRAGQDPDPALSDLRAALARCQPLEDAGTWRMCRTLAPQAEWVAADWLAAHKQPFLPQLQAALSLSLQATQDPRKDPAVWRAWLRPTSAWRRRSRPTRQRAGIMSPRDSPQPSTSSPSIQTTAWDGSSKGRCIFSPRWTSATRTPAVAPPGLPWNPWSTRSAAIPSSCSLVLRC